MRATTILRAGVPALIATAIAATLLRTPAARRFRHDAWSRRGDAAFLQDDWDRASKWYRRAIRAVPDQASTWAALIMSELQARCGHTAEQLACQAAQIPGMDPWDLLGFRAAAAWLRRDHEALHTHLQRLHEGDPEMAKSLAEALQVKPPHREDKIDGYA